MIDTSVVEKYLSGRSLASLSKEYHISAYLLKKDLIKNGVKIRSQKEQNKYSPQNQRKYNINDLYFSKQSQNMAYLLGFFAADGCVYKEDNKIKITLASIDRDFLEIIKAELNSDFPIRDYETKQGYKNSEFVFSSFQIKKDFSNYNIIPLKTYNFKFPDKLKKEYYRDFIRGYFDGDGSVSTAGPALRWQICSYEKDVLEKIVIFLEEQGVPKVNIQKYSNKHLYYIQYSTNSVKKIYNILYYDNCLCLPRKFKKYQSLMK